MDWVDWSKRRQQHRLMARYLLTQARLRVQLSTLLSPVVLRMVFTCLTLRHHADSDPIMHDINSRLHMFPWCFLPSTRSQPVHTVQGNLFLFFIRRL